MSDDRRSESDADSGYRYDEDAEGHENQLEFDRDYTTFERLKDTGLISKEREEAVRQDLEVEESSLEEGEPEA